MVGQDHPQAQNPTHLLSCQCSLDMSVPMVVTCQNKYGIGGKTVSSAYLGIPTCHWKGVEVVPGLCLPTKAEDPGCWGPQPMPPTRLGRQHRELGRLFEGDGEQGLGVSKGARC